MNKPNSNWLDCHSWPAEIRESDILIPAVEDPEPGTRDYYYQGITDPIFELRTGGES